LVLNKKDQMLRNFKKTNAKKEKEAKKKKMTNSTNNYLINFNR
jgi:hypothetical protein